jgi:hypothetical protein
MMYRRRTRAALTTCAILIAGIFLSYQTPGLVSLARNVAFHVPSASFPEQHGIWHNVYIGLGVVANPLGIVWEDGNAKMAAERIDPSVTYLSAKYFAILRDEYFRVLTQHPLEVANVYREKLHLIFETNLPAELESWLFWQAWVFLFVVGAYARGLLFYRRPGLHAADAVLAVAILFTVFFVGQGTLVHFSLQYLFPIHLFFLLWAGAIVEYLRLTFFSPVGRQLRYEPVQHPVRQQAEQAR